MFRDKEGEQALAGRVEIVQIDNMVRNEYVAQDFVAKVEGEVEEAEVLGHDINVKKLFRSILESAICRFAGDKSFRTAAPQIHVQQLHSEYENIQFISIKS